MEQKRLDQFDILKAIGIILVIVGHTVQSHYIINIIYSFHMPLFFLVSGYFLKHQENKIPIRTYARRLLLPYLFSACVLVAISVGLHYFNQQEATGAFSLTWIKSILYGNGAIWNNAPYLGVGALWFLLALFWAMLIVQAVLTFRNSITPALCILLCTILALYTAKKQIQLPFSIQQGLFSSLYLYIGYLIKQYHPTIKLTARFSWIILLIIWIMSIKSGFLSILQCYATPEIITLAGALAGTYFMYLLSVKIARTGNFLHNRLTEIGKLTLLILCIHAIEDILVPWQEWMQWSGIESGILKISLISIIRITAILAMTFLMKKIPFVRQLFKIQS